MAIPAYATDLDDIFTDGGTWTTLTGRETDPDTDDYIQGSSCWSHDPFSSGIEGGVVNSAETITAGDAVFVWTKADISPALATHAAGGVQVLIGNASTALKCFYVAGSDTLTYGGWKCIPVDPTKTPSTNIGSPSSVTAYFGVRWNIPATGPNKGYPFKIDAIRHGKNLEITAGEIANPATWDTTSAYDATTTRQWGICQPTNTGAAIQGYVYWGTAAAEVYSRDSNKTIVINHTEWTDTDFTQIIFAHASNDIVWDNIGLIALGTNNRGIIDVTANGDITWTNSVYQGIDTTTLLSNSTFDGSTWIGTNEIDGGGGSLVGCSMLTPTVAADSYALLWNVATSTDGLLDNLTMSEGTNSHHAIEFGTSAPTAIYINSLDVGTDFAATNGQTNSTFNFLESSSAVTYNVYCSSCIGNMTYKSAGAIVNIIEDPVTVQATVTTTTGVPISGARVYIQAKDGTGDFPFEDVVTISNSGTTATVTHAAHGMASNDYVMIDGGTVPANEGVFQITYISTSSYSYTMLSTPGVSPTGTITSTFVALYGLTNASGVTSTGRVYSNPQPITGWARKSTSSPYYKEGSISGTISTTDGLTATAVLVLDE